MPEIPGHSANGVLIGIEELRARELEIIEGVPPPVSRFNERLLLNGDPKLGPALAKLVCHGNGCNEERPCGNCLVKRRYLTLLLHRKKHGRIILEELVPLPAAQPQRSSTEPEKTDALDLPEVIDAMDLLAAEDVQPPQSLPLLGQEAYIVKGVSNILAAFPKVGKTSVVYQSIPDWLKAESVLYITEEPKLVWQERLRNVPVIEQRGLNLVFAMGWDAAVLLKMAEGPETVIVLDTLRGLSILPRDENQNGEIAVALQPWLRICRDHGKTLLAIHHDNKAGGSGGRGVSGGHALVGCADVILEIRPGRGKEHRVVSVLSRFSAPPDLTYRMREDKRLEVVEAEEQAEPPIKPKEPRASVVESLPKGPPGWTLDEITKNCHVANVKASLDLGQSVETKTVIRKGTGVKGDPFRWFRA